VRFVVSEIEGELRKRGGDDERVEGEGDGRMGPGLKEFSGDLGGATGAVSGGGPSRPGVTRAMVEVIGSEGTEG